jgi:hypothetical protein
MIIPGNQIAEYCCMHVQHAHSIVETGVNNHHTNNLRPRARQNTPSIQNRGYSQAALFFPLPSLGVSLLSVQGSIYWD